MNTLHTLTLRYINPSSRLEISDELMLQHPDREMRLTLARAIGRIGRCFGQKEFDGNIFPRVVEDPRVRSGMLRVALRGMDQPSLRVLLYTNDQHVSRFEPPHYRELPQITASDAVIKAYVRDTPEILPANGWR